MSSERNSYSSEVLNRRSWFLWGVTLAVVVGLAAAVPLLYLPLFRTLASEEASRTSASNA